MVIKTNCKLKNIIHSPLFPLYHATIHQYRLTSRPAMASVRFSAGGMCKFTCVSSLSLRRTLQLYSSLKTSPVVELAFRQQCGSSSVNCHDAKASKQIPMLVTMLLKFCVAKLPGCRKNFRVASYSCQFRN